MYTLLGPLKESFLRSYDILSTKRHNTKEMIDYRYSVFLDPIYQTGIILNETQNFEQTSIHHAYHLQNNAVVFPVFEPGHTTPSPHPSRIVSRPRQPSGFTSSHHHHRYGVRYGLISLAWITSVWFRLTVPTSNQNRSRGEEANRRRRYEGDTAKRLNC